MIKTTPFRQAVWEVLLTIPYGRTMTYGEIADRIAKQEGLSKMSAQAVGGAVGHNPISLIIPCHRVVGTKGSLTGYAGGIDKKVQLLTLEKSRYVLFFCAEERNCPMISTNAKAIQASFTRQAENFETKAMSFSKQEYLEHTVSCANPKKDGHRAGSSGRHLRLWTQPCSICPDCDLPRYDGGYAGSWKRYGGERGILQYELCPG